MLARTALPTIYTATRAAFSVSVRAGKAAVDADFFDSLTVFLSEIFAEVIVKHNSLKSHPCLFYISLSYF